MVFKAAKAKAIDVSSLARLGASTVDLAKYVEDEFAQVASSLQGNDPFTVLYVAPSKPRQGMLVYADGIHWNPGNGEGFYQYTSSAVWVPVFINTLSGVISIAGNKGVFTLSHGLINSVNDLRLDVGNFRGFLAGLTLSTAGSSSTFSVAVGVSVDDTQTDFMKLAASINKTTGAWVVGSGNGALDTGTIATNTWYHVFEIKRPDTGVVDILISTSLTPAMPTNYTLKRRIGSIKTDGSSNWTSFSQYEDTFYWGASFLDVNTTPTSNVDVTQTFTVPLGARVKPLLRVGIQSATQNAIDIAIRSPDLMSAESTPEVEGATASSGITIGGSTVTRIGGDVRDVHTNTSGQLVYRVYAPSGGTLGNVLIRTYGWVDTRGRYA